ncbi:F-box/kelch-repeat protein [Dendrobium catenatum]|uniref:F-box/kelch-repeat protein n=1 Tax=Dendrobium catenatum TaxID=906689 RepID=A0A2I0VRH5_9ASPA|nr:F-box/kelch-repeat protein [Dendrobium catenatum]
MNFPDMEDLIPGLPEEIGLECLIRAPHKTLPLLQQVCRRKQATESPFFHHLCRFAGSSHHLIIFIEAHYAVRCSLRFFSSHPYCRLVALNLSTGEWASLRPIPLVSLDHPFFFCVFSSCLHLVVNGGGRVRVWAWN